MTFREVSDDLKDTGMKVLPILAALGIGSGLYLQAPRETAPVTAQAATPAATPIPRQPSLREQLGPGRDELRYDPTSRSLVVVPENVSTMTAHGGGQPAKSRRQAGPAKVTSTPDPKVPGSWMRAREYQSPLEQPPR